MRKNPNGRHISLDFEPQFKALKDFFTKKNPYLIFWGTFTVSVLFWRWYLSVPKNAKKYHFGYSENFTTGGIFLNFNHFWNQWPKLIPKLALNLDFDHFKGFWLFWVIFGIPKPKKGKFRKNVLCYSKNLKTKLIRLVTLTLDTPP